MQWCDGAALQAYTISIHILRKTDCALSTLGHTKFSGDCEATDSEWRFRVELDDPAPGPFRRLRFGGFGGKCCCEPATRGNLFSVPLVRSLQTSRRTPQARTACGRRARCSGATPRCRPAGAARDTPAAAVAAAAACLQEPPVVKMQSSCLHCCTAASADMLWHQWSAWMFGHQRWAAPLCPSVAAGPARSLCRAAAAAVGDSPRAWLLVRRAGRTRRKGSAGLSSSTSH